MKHIAKVLLLFIEKVIAGYTFEVPVLTLFIPIGSV